MTRCTLCPRRCGTPRGEARGGGRCRAGWLPRVARAALHFGEEPCISGMRGSGAVFFCGCALGCLFCQNEAISGAVDAGPGPAPQALSPQALAGVLQSLQAQGAHNLNLVTATHYAPAVAQALRIARPRIPVVCNTSGYESAETLAPLDGLVDVFLPDFKYADADTALYFADAPDYPHVALEAIVRMHEMAGPARYDADGLMTRGVLVRHLVLPGLAGASMRALSMLRDALGPDVPVSLMGQYTPMGRAKQIPGLDRPVSRAAYRSVCAHMRAIGLNGYRQSPDASGTAMMPAWDGSGVARGRPG